jgi:hypothetical protein
MEEELIEQEDGEYDYQVEKPRVKYRIGLLFTIFLGFIGIVADVAEPLLAIFTVEVGSYIKDFLVFVILPVLFFIKGVPFWKGKQSGTRIAVFIGATIVSIIPILGDISPETFVEVLTWCLVTRKEDREKAEEGITFSQSANSNITRSKNTPPPLPKKDGVTRVARNSEAGSGRVPGVVRGITRR